MAKDAILLESGTDELEVLEFALRGNIFGVNVLKIQSIEQFDESKLTKLPTGTPANPGVFLFRNNTIPMIDLSEELGLQGEDSKKIDSGIGQEKRNAVVLVTQFNSMMIAFRVDSAIRIHRVRWGDICPMAEIFDQGGACAFTGSVNIEDHETLIVDMESISEKYFPTQGLLDLVHEEFSHSLQHERPNVKIMLVEDSKTVRRVICDVLARGDYTDVTTFDNGKLAYDALVDLIETAHAAGDPISKYADIIITDIEMPQMDGLTLCHHVKFRHNLADLPVVLYSSLRRDQMINKCKDVKADAYIPKPDCVRLVKMVDCICLDKKLTGMPYSVE
ncbi:MAG: chemotaxis protein CheW [Pontiellaceae bacterium]|nr:chemotaxis protein CheW [Pontiellaceae bacterium]